MNSFILVSVIVSTLGKFASAVPLGNALSTLQADDSMNAFMEGRMLNHMFASPPSIRKGLIIVTTVAADDSGYVPQNMSILLDAKVNGKDVVTIPIKRQEVIPGVMVKEQYNTELQYANHNFNPAQLESAGSVAQALKSGKEAITQFWDKHKATTEYADFDSEDLEFAYRPYWIIVGRAVYKFVKVIAVDVKP